MTQLRPERPSPGLLEESKADPSGRILDGREGLDRSPKPKRSATTKNESKRPGITSIRTEQMTATSPEPSRQTVDRRERPTEPIVPFAIAKGDSSVRKSRRPLKPTTIAIIAEGVIKETPIGENARMVDLTMSYASERVL